MAIALKWIPCCVVLLSVLSGAVYAQDAAPGSPSLVASALQYEHAEGVPRDFQKAAALYCAAAKDGNAQAQFSLGWMYANGRGVARDDHIAAQLFAMAAKQGQQTARSMLHYTPPPAAVLMPACLNPDTVQPAATGDHPNVSGPLISASNPISKLVTRLALQYEVDPQLVMTVIAIESGFNVNARSSRNAQGLMQLIPETAQRFRVKNTLNAEDNVRGGIAYLKWLLAYFKGNVQMVAAAYNAGEGAVEKYHGIPPYPETQEYVRRFARLYQRTDHPYQASLVKASFIVRAMPEAAALPP